MLAFCRAWVRPWLLLVLASAPLSWVHALDPGENPPYAAALLMEPETNSVLFAYNAHKPRSPASTQKLLLELVVLDMVESGKFSLDEEVEVSAWASRIGGSQVYLKQGEVFSLEVLMEAIAIHSANDACVAVAEHIGGSAEGFVDLMNAKARQLGLAEVRCVNVHGLDDTPLEKSNRTTAYALSQIARKLLNYPEVLTWSSIVRKPFRDGTFTLYNTNTLLDKFKGMDGLKTGFTSRAGFCLVATAQRDSLRLVAVVLGAPNEGVRSQEIKRLLSWGFNTYKKMPLVEAGATLDTVAVDWGLEGYVLAQTERELIAVLNDEQQASLERQVELAVELEAPVAAGDSLGVLRYTMGDSLLASINIVADRSIARMTFWERIMSIF
ncbi:MAG: D-alanyl-D-alanine carboxypeptidase [Candidatus Latescibacteria bacterium]|nr:D-alanyl-D-alanine carboxypeptidase [Candidatus Latescibacterota bacterium]